MSFRFGPLSGGAQGDLVRSAEGLIDHLEVASGVRQGMTVLDLRKDTSPNHGETIVLGFEALAHLEKSRVSKQITRNLSSRLDPAQGNFRQGKDDATYVKQVASTAISALQSADYDHDRDF